MDCIKNLPKEMDNRSKQRIFEILIFIDSDNFNTSYKSVQYCGGCSVQWRLFSTLEVVQYIGGCSVHRGDNISTVRG